MASARTLCLPLTALDVASGIPVGAAPPAPTPVEPRGVRSALEASIRPALQRPPCFVAFSGGRDSSTVLAVADRLATREGLPRPVALTARFPEAPAADESEWQELTTSWLGIEAWERLSLRAAEVEGFAPSVERGDASGTRSELWNADARKALSTEQRAAVDNAG